MNNPQWTGTTRKIGGILMMGCGAVLLILFILDHFGLTTSGLSPESRMLGAGMGIILLLGGYFQYDLARKR